MFTLEQIQDHGLNPVPEKTPIVLFQEFPHLIDNTAREQFFTCPTKWKYSTINKIAPDPSSVHLHAGGAYAAGLETLRKSFYDRGKSEQDSLADAIEAAYLFYGDFECPPQESKTAERIAGALVSYVDEYPLASDAIKPYRYSSGKHAIEFTFAVPLPIMHPVTGDPILYGGRFDMLAVREGSLFVVDDKTTKQLGPQWPSQWELNSQFTGYVWAAKQYDLPVAGAIIRGQSILKTGYGHAQVVTYRPQWQLDRWYSQLLRDIERMIETWKTGVYDLALGSACSAYSGCEFKRLCLSNSPDDWLATYYKQRHWNPLAKDPEETDVTQGEVIISLAKSEV